MSSLYAQYLMERTDDLIVENADGFATYRYLNDGKSVYIVDLFVTKEARRARKATYLADMIVSEARDRGCTKLVGSVVPSAKNSTASLEALIYYGMTLDSAGNDLIIFRKDI